MYSVIKYLLIDGSIIPAMNIQTVMGVFCPKYPGFDGCMLPEYPGSDGCMLPEYPGSDGCAAA
jgi:hypothetical protein